MPELIRVRKKAQITLPQSVRQALNIEEGDFLDVRVNDGEIVLRVKKLVDASQAYFWTEEWQKGERKADEAIKAGRVKRFKSADDVVKYLEGKA